MTDIRAVDSRPAAAGGPRIDGVRDRARSRDRRTAIVFVCAFAAVWGAVEMLGAFTGVAPLQVVWIRYGVHLSFMLLIWAPRRGLGLVYTRRPWTHVLRSLLMLGMPLSYLAAAQRLGLRETLGLFWIAPLLCLFANRGGTQGRRAWIAGGLGYAGALLIVHPHGVPLRLAAAFPIAMAVCFAGYLWLTDHLTEESEATNLFHSALWVFVALTPAMPGVWRTPSIKGWIAMTAIGLLGLLALLFVDRASRKAPLTSVAPALYSQAVLAALLSVALAHQPLSGPTLVGAVIVVAALGLLWS